MSRKTIIIGAAILIVAGLFVLLASFKNTTTVIFPTESFEVLVADNFVEQQKGLSGTEIDTLGADGMLFVFDDKKERVFWMNGMNYALDIVWIRDNKVVLIEENVLPPEGNEDPVRMYSRPFEIDKVIEFPAGVVRRAGIVEGHVIQIEE